MRNGESLLNAPVTIYNNGQVSHYYGSYIATIKDGFEPRAVLRVCEGKQITHKGKKFIFLSDLGIVGEKIYNDIKKKKGGGFMNGK